MGMVGIVVPVAEERDGEPGEVVAAEDRLGVGDGGAGGGADDVELDAHTTAGLADRRHERELVREIAVDHRAPRLRRERLALPKGAHVDGVEQHGNSLGGDARARQEAVGAGVVDGDVSKDSGESRRGAGEVFPAVADEDRRRRRKVEQRRHGLERAVAVDDVDRRGDGAQVVDDRDRQRIELARGIAELRGVDDRRMAAGEQPRRQVALVTLHAADLAERMAGDQNAHERFSNSARSASRNGSMCSPRRTCTVGLFRESQRWSRSS